MPSLNGITVQVVCEGSPLEEYATLVDLDKPSVVSCWIASTADKEFAIQYEFETEESWGWSCILYCDGLFIAGHLMNPRTKRYTQGHALSGDKAHPIMFSEMVESDSQEGTDHGNADMGLIEIKVWRVKPHWEIGNQPLKKITIDESPIHESKKMLGGHRIKLGEPKVNLNTTLAHPVYLDKTPHRTFRFYYRPLSLLRALGHAPVVSSTPVTAVKRSASVLSDSNSNSKSDAESEADAEDERIAKLKREINARQEELAKITQKDESKPSNGRHKAKRLKREEAPIIVPPSLMEGVIDLCSD